MYMLSLSRYSDHSDVATTPEGPNFEWAFKCCTTAAKLNESSVWLFSNEVVSESLYVLDNFLTLFLKDPMFLTWTICDGKC